MNKGILNHQTVYMFYRYLKDQKKSFEDIYNEISDLSPVQTGYYYEALCRILVCLEHCEDESKGENFHYLDGNLEENKHQIISKHKLLGHWKKQKISESKKQGISDIKFSTGFVGENFTYHLYSVKSQKLHVSYDKTDIDKIKGRIYDDKITIKEQFKDCSIDIGIISPNQKSFEKTSGTNIKVIDNHYLKNIFSNVLQIDEDYFNHIPEYKLYVHQKIIVQKIFAFVREEIHNIGLYLKCRSGKTVIAMHAISKINKSKKNILWVSSHPKETFDDVSNYIDDSVYDVCQQRKGIENILKDKEKSKFVLVSIQTLIRLEAEHPFFKVPFEVMIVDEADRNFTAVKSEKAWNKIQFKYRFFLTGTESKIKNYLGSKKIAPYREIKYKTQDEEILKSGNIEKIKTKWPEYTENIDETDIAPYRKMPTIVRKKLPSLRQDYYETHVRRKDEKDFLKNWDYQLGYVTNIIFNGANENVLEQYVEAIAKYILKKHAAFDQKWQNKTWIIVRIPQYKGIDQVSQLVRKEFEKTDLIKKEKFFIREINTMNKRKELEWCRDHNQSATKQLLITGNQGCRGINFPNARFIVDFDMNLYKADNVEQIENRSNIAVSGKDKVYIITAQINKTLLDYRAIQLDVEEDNQTSVEHSEPHFIYQYEESTLIDIDNPNFNKEDEIRPYEREFDEKINRSLIDKALAKDQKHFLEEHPDYLAQLEALDLPFDDAEKIKKNTLREIDKKKKQIADKYENDATLWETEEQKKRKIEEDQQQAEAVIRKKHEAKLKMELGKLFGKFINDTIIAMIICCLQRENFDVENIDREKLKKCMIRILSVSYDFNNKQKQEDAATLFYQYFNDKHARRRLSSKVENVIRKIRYNLKKAAPRQIIDVISEEHKITSINTKKFGEVLTPYELIEKGFDQLLQVDPDFFKNPEHKILDPTLGTGRMLAVAYEYFMEGIVAIFPDEEERRRHIIEHCLYGVEIQELNYEISLLAFNSEIKGGDYNYKTNIYHGDFLKVEEIKELEGMKFDFIVSNPPYNKAYKKKMGMSGSNHYYMDFINRYFDWLENEKYMYILLPNKWKSIYYQKSVKDIYTKLRTYYKPFVQLFSIEQGQGYFNSGTSFSTILCQNNLNTKKHKTIVIDDECKKYRENIDNKNIYAHIPNNDFELFKLCTDSKYKKIKIIYSRSEYGHDKNWVSKQKTKKYCYPIYYKQDMKEKITAMYSDVFHEHHFVKKLIIHADQNENFITKDSENKYGLSQFAIGIPAKDDKHLEKMYRLFRHNHKFRKFIFSLKIGNHAFNYRTLSLLRADIFDLKIWEE